ncbi:MAG: BlaI/MecI/CopY family transcriptional regulator [Deltaproteobacteria bacterium]|nr:BlaI/MecI/CopY family transcriptional regulator [Deltaproteobacteria bacterium]
MKKKNIEDTEKRLLTEVELELMTILWRINEGTVGQVMSELPEGRELAYTSVSTILRILEQKKILGTRKEGRGHIYIPLMTKSDYEEKTVRHVVDNIFDGAPISLIKRLLDTVSITEEELEEIKDLIKKNGKKK